MDYAYQNLRSPQNVSIKGIAEFALLCPVADFEADGIKSPAAPFVEQGDEIKIKEPHVNKAGKGFIYFALAPQKNKLDSKTSGDRGLQSIDSSVEIFVPGSYAEAHEQMQKLLNVPLIALFKDASCKDNIFYQLGCDCIFAWVNWEFTTGTTKDGVKGFAVKIECDLPLQIYDVEGGPQILAD